MGAGARRAVVDGAAAPFALLQEAAVACVTQATFAAAAEAGAAGAAVGAAPAASASDAAAAAEFAEWVEGASAELALIRAWRGRTPAFASARHDAAAAATYLLWKDPAAHGVAAPLPRERVQATCELLQASPPGDDAAVARALDALAAHAPPEDVAALVDSLALWFELGAGCRVVANNPPALAGAVPAQLARVWGRVGTLMEFGLLTYDGSGRGYFLYDSGLAYAPGALAVDSA